MEKEKVCTCNESEEMKSSKCSKDKNLSCCREEKKICSSCSEGAKKCSSKSGGDCSCGAPKPKGKNNLKVQIIKLCVAFVFLILGFFDWKSISQGKFLAFYYVNSAWVTIILCGVPIFIAAVKTLMQKKIKANVLISVAMLSCIVLETVGFFVPIGGMISHIKSNIFAHSYIFAAGEVAFLMSVGNLIEDFTVKKCRSGIERLVGLIPKKANVLVDGKIVVTSLENVCIGDIVLVRAGEMVAVDGEVIEGTASIDQSSVTGEYLPIDVKKADNVYGGTMNKSGTIEVRTTKLQKDMTIARLAELTIEAEGKKAPVSRLADKWVAVIVPSVIVLAIFVGLIRGLAIPNPDTPIQAFVSGITVMVVFCPCAFALATPTAIAAGLGRSAKNGVLIKSGASLEELAKVKIVCFDKTGTLTSGQIRLSDIKGNDDILRLSASLEKYSEHPLSKAVVKAAKDMKLSNATDIKTLQGEGISGVVDGKNVEIISYSAAKQRNLKIDEMGANTYLEKGNTISVVLIDSKLYGFLVFTDTIREDSFQCINDLKGMGIETYMLTGDNMKSAKGIADSCGIDNIKAELLPEQKLNAIVELKQNGKVCMLGDGINDAPSLATADVGIAMGALGSEIAIDTADMAILDDNISKINETLKLSKKVMRTIKRNITIAMTINTIAVVLSFLGFLNPVLGALLHNCTSLIVVSSSALLLIKRKEKKDKKEKVEAKMA